MKKRIISLLLALIMALSLFPVSALAVESSAEPTISADLPAEVALQPGDNFALTVTALGSGTLSYQWYANTVSDYAGGTKIKGAESATYDVATAVEQVLYYYVEVTNTEGGEGPGHGALGYLQGDRQRERQRRAQRHPRDHQGCGGRGRCGSALARYNASCFRYSYTRPGYDQGFLPVV